MHLNLTIKQLVDMVEGECSFNHSFVIQKLASLEQAEPDDIAVVFDAEENSVFAPLSPEKIKQSKAQLILASSPLVSGKNYILVKDPLTALQKIADHVKNMGTNFRKNLSEVIVNEDDELTIILSLNGTPSSAFLGKENWSEKIKKLKKIVNFMEKKGRIPAVINLTNSKKVVVKFSH